MLNGTPENRIKQLLNRTKYNYYEVRMIYTVFNHLFLFVFRHGIVGSYEKETLGVTVGRSICTGYSTTIIKDTGPFMTTHATAHELAHA